MKSHLNLQLESRNGIATHRPDILGILCTRYFHDRRCIATLSIVISVVHRRQAEANMLRRQQHTSRLIDSPQQGNLEIVWQ